MIVVAIIIIITVAVVVDVAIVVSSFFSILFSLYMHSQTISTTIYVACVVCFGRVEFTYLSPSLCKLFIASYVPKLKYCMPQRRLFWVPYIEET